MTESIRPSIDDRLVLLLDLAISSISVCNTCTSMAINSHVCNVHSILMVLSEQPLGITMTNNLNRILYACSTWIELSSPALFAQNNNRFDCNTMTGKCWQLQEINEHTNSIMIILIYEFVICFAGINIASCAIDATFET